MFKIVYPICCGMDVHKTSVFRKQPDSPAPKWGGSRFSYKFSEGRRPYWNVMLLRMMSGIVPGTQSNFVSPMDSARPSSICATYWIQL